MMISVNDTRWNNQLICHKDFGQKMLNDIRLWQRRITGEALMTQESGTF